MAPLGEMQRGSGGTSGFDLKAHVGHITLFINNEERKDVQTRFGPRDAAESEYVACVTDEMVYRNHLTFAVAMVPDLVANPVVAYGTIGMGEARGGQSAPWILFDLTPDERAIATQWWDAHTFEMPSGRIGVEVIDPDAGEAF